MTINQSKFYLKSVHFITIQHKLLKSSQELFKPTCITKLHKLNTAQQKHVIQYKTNTHPDKPMHTSLCFDLWTPTSASLRTHCHRTRGQNRKKMPTFSSHYTYKYIHANYNQSIFKQRSKLTQNT
jgi:hypothetical protein